MFMLLSALLWLENTWFITPLPWTRQTLFCFWSVNAIAVYFLSLSFFVSSWPESWDSDFSVDRENCQGVMLFVSLCHQARRWRPGRVETAAAEWGRAWIRSARSPCALYRLSGLRRPTRPFSSAFNISCRPWAGRCWACASSWSFVDLRLTLYQTVLGTKG